MYKRQVGNTDYPQFLYLGYLYLFIEWLLRTFPKQKNDLSDRAQEYFYSIINYIEVHFCSDLTVQKIAHDLGFDRTYIFKPVSYTHLSAFSAGRIIA